MKRTNLKGIFILASFCLLLVGCHPLKVISSPYKNIQINKNQTIHFHTDESSYPKGIQAINIEVINDSKHEISYGMGFSLEKEEEHWMEVVPSIETSIKEIGIILKPGEQRKETIELTSYSLLPEGTYRIIRNISGNVYSANFDIK